jgi:hypothetical protein
MKAIDRERSMADRIKLLMTAYADMVNRLAATITTGRDRALRDRTLTTAASCDSFQAAMEAGVAAIVNMLQISGADWRKTIAFLPTWGSTRWRFRATTATTCSPRRTTSSSVSWVNHR